MRKTYSHLTEDERIEIYAGLQAGKTKTQIAKALSRSTSTITREIERNTGGRGYRPKQAQAKACQRRREASKAIKMTRKNKQLISKKIREEWSPEQISGWFDRYQVVSISHERIYQHVWEDKCRGGGLWKHLRQSSKKYKKRRGGRDRRGQIPNRVSIDQRPHTIELRRRFGDWEGDTIVGKGHRGALITLVERKSKYLLMKQVDRYTSQEVREEIEAMISQDNLPFKSMTVDNGREFACHEQITERFEMPIYFAHPYHSWERGLNENTNGLVRQYFAKGSTLKRITDAQVQRVQDKLNHRPRKSLGYKSPHEILVEGKRIKL